MVVVDNSVDVEWGCAGIISSDVVVLGGIVIDAAGVYVISLQNMFLIRTNSVCIFRSN